LIEANPTVKAMTSFDIVADRARELSECDSSAEVGILLDVTYSPTTLPQPFLHASPGSLLLRIGRCRNDSLLLDFL
jgi:hypothetical protein